MEDDIDLDDFTRYDEFVHEFMTDDELLEQFEIQGPGPPDKSMMRRLIPAPPIPGKFEDCLAFSSHFDTCSSLMVIYLFFSHIGCLLKSANNSTLILRHSSLFFQNYDLYLQILY